MNVLVIYGTHEAPAIQNIYFNNPLKILEKKRKVNFILTDLANFSFKEIYEYHLIVISRIFRSEILDLIEFCKKANKPIYFFFDDDILHFPIEYYLNHEPFYKNNETLIKAILGNSSALIVSTDKLKHAYSGYNPSIYVVAPSLDISFIEGHQRKIVKYDDAKFTIGYAGSFGHVIDFRFLEKALLDFYKKHQPNVCIEFMGCVPELFGGLIDDNSIKFTHWKPDYEQYLNNVLGSDWDIALCPVLDSDYTSHKTNIKFLEYSAARIPGIYSDISIYNKDITDPKNGFLATNDYQSWTEKLEYAFRNRSILTYIADSAHDHVTDRYADKRSADQWSVILLDLQKKGIKKISEDLSIRKHKVKKVYARTGLSGIAKKVSQLYVFKKMLRQKHVLGGGNNGTEEHCENYDLIFKDVEKNFDDKIIRKQILFILPWLSVGGGDMVNLSIASQLDKEKYTLHFITTEVSKHEWQDRFEQISKNIFHVRKAIEQADHFWEYNLLILEYIRRANIDIIIVSNSANGYNSLPAIKEKFDYIRTVDILHGQGGAKEGGGFPEYSKPYDKYINRRITINNYLKNYMVRNYGIVPAKIEVIYNGIDIDKYKKNGSTGNRPVTVTYIGRLTYEKHPEKIIDIADCYLKKFKTRDIRFNIVGNGPLYDGLKKEISERGLDGFVELHGYKDDIKGELENTDILILCSEMEGLPIVLLEAMSMSTPCIASNVGGIPELIDQGINGFLIDYGPGMAEEFADKTRLLSQDKSLRTSVGVKAREKVVEYFSYSKMRDAYLKVLD